MAHKGFIELGYEPRNDELLVEFRVEPSPRVDFRKAVEHLVGESSIGTWTEVEMKPEISEELSPHVFDMSEHSKRIRVAYPVALFERGNMAQILSSIAGNIFGMKSIHRLRLEDVKFPTSMMKSFPGPKFGIFGIRNLLDVTDRPLIGTIVKPKVGLSAEEHAQAAYEAWVGGCDLVKDDENLTSQKFNPFQDRVLRTLKMRNKAEEKTGERKIYIPNITAETAEMIRRAGFIEVHGCEYAMVDILTVGFSAMQSLREADLNLVLHGHRAMHASLTRDKRHGISMLVLAKISRLIGVDQLHIGTVVGKMESERDEVLAIRDAITEDWAGIKPGSLAYSSGLHPGLLNEEWDGIKRVFPVCSGGLHPGLVPELMGILGEDIIIQAGGGIAGHPDGIRAGATAMKQAVDAVMEGSSLKDYAKKHKELKKALEKWGSG